MPGSGGQPILCALLEVTGASTYTHTRSLESQIGLNWRRIRARQPRGGITPQVSFGPQSCGGGGEQQLLQPLGGRVSPESWNSYPVTGGLCHGSRRMGFYQSVSQDNAHNHGCTWTWTRTHSTRAGSSRGRQVPERFCSQLSGTQNSTSQPDAFVTRNPTLLRVMCNTFRTGQTADCHLSAFPVGTPLSGTPTQVRRVGVSRGSGDRWMVA